MSVIQSFTPSHLLHQADHVAISTASRISVQSLTGRSSPISGGAIPSSRLGSSNTTSNPVASGSSDSSRRPLFSPTQVSAPAAQRSTIDLPAEPILRTPVPRAATPPQLRPITSRYALSSSPEEEARPTKGKTGRATPSSDPTEPEEPVEGLKQPSSPRAKNVVQVVLSSRHRSPPKRIRQCSPSSPDPLNLGFRSSGSMSDNRTPLISTKRGEVLPPASERLTPQDSFAESAPVVRISARQQQAKAKEEAATAERRRLRAERKAREAEEKRRAGDAAGHGEESIEYIGQSSGTSSKRLSQRDSKPAAKKRAVDEKVPEEGSKRSKRGVLPQGDVAELPSRTTRKDRRSGRHSSEKTVAADLGGEQVHAAQSEVAQPTSAPAALSPYFESRESANSPAKIPAAAAASRSPITSTKRTKVTQSSVKEVVLEAVAPEKIKTPAPYVEESANPATEASKSPSPPTRSPLKALPARLNSPALSVSSPVNRYSPGPSKDGIKWKTNRSDLSSVLSKFQGSKSAGMSRKLKIVPLHAKIGPPAKAPPPLPKKPEKRKKGDSDEETEEEGDGEERRAKRDKEWLMQDDQGF